jgi:hypothetical protein
VSSFNGRTGAITPQSGDYTAAQVGAVSTASVTGGNQQIAQNGYQYLPGGLILQWGLANAINGSSPTNVTFPLTFPNACFVVSGTAIIQPTGNTPDTVLTMDQNAVQTGFSARLGGQGGSSFWLNGPFYWFAIGN